MIIDVNGDNEIQETEAQNVYELIVTSKSISDLTGILSFTNIHTLYCSVNNITELNIGDLNTNLRFLNASFNSISSFDASLNSNLTTLAITHNLLTNLDVSQNNSLTHLSCGGNSLTSVDISNNPNINRFHCSNSPLLTYLNLKNGNNLNFNFPNASFYQNVPNLQRVCVDQLNTNLTAKILEQANHDVCFVTDCTITDCNTASVSEENILLFQLYPNPVNNILRVKTKASILTIEIYNELVQLVLKNKIKNEIDISNLNQGLYLVKIEDVNGNFDIKKIIKE